MPEHFDGLQIPLTKLFGQSPAGLNANMVQCPHFITLSRQSRNQRGDSIVRRCQSCREPDDGVAHGAL